MDFHISWVSMDNLLDFAEQAMIPYLSIGPKARILGTRPELNLASIVLVSILAQRNVFMQISHGMDGKHKRASIHLNGGAYDYVFLNGGTYDKDEIVEVWRAGLGQDFDVLLENPGLANEHVHVEYQPKNPY